MKGCPDAAAVSLRTLAGDATMFRLELYNPLNLADENIPLPGLFAKHDMPFLRDVIERYNDSTEDDPTVTHSLGVFSVQNPVHRPVATSGKSP